MPVANARRRLALLLTAPLMLALVACEPQPAPPSAISETLGRVDFSPPERDPSVEPARPAPTGTEGEAPKSELYLGGEAVTGEATAARAARVEDGVQLNFDGADLKEVVQVILGDILDATYTIDPSLSGPVVMSSGAPLSDDDLLHVLSSILDMHGAALVDRGGSYAVVLAEEASGRARVAPLSTGRPPRAGPGTGLTIVPLRYMSANAAAQFVQPLLRRPEQIRVDDTRNLLLFAGTPAERQTVLDTLADIDVNWMAGRSVGIFPLEVGTPEAVIPELEALFSSLTAPEAGTETIRFLPMARLNAVLAVANQPEQVVEAEKWVERLDRGNTVGTRFFVHQLKHAPAEEVAALLAESFAGLGETEETGEDGAFVAEVAADPFAEGGDNGPFAEGGDSGDIPGPPQRPDRAAGVAAASLGQIKVVPNPRNNTLVIRGSEEAYRMIQSTLRQIDTAPLQVLIEATIAEVTLNDQLRYGVQYFLESGSLGVGFNTSTPSDTGVATRDQITPLGRLPGFNFIFTPGSSNITIDALSRITDVKVLSSPSLVVQDNREAVLTVGDEVPITTRTAVSVDDPTAPVVNNIEFRETGVILEVKPRISSNDIVAMQVAQEVSRVASESAGQADTLTPTISQRRITSDINVASGQTVVLGGLIQDSETVSQDKVPLLGDIPALGNLFRRQNNQNARTELIVFITPRIIRNAEDARDISEELRARMRSIRPDADRPLPPARPDRPPRDLDVPRSGEAEPSPDGDDAAALAPPARPVPGAPGEAAAATASRTPEADEPDEPDKAAAPARAQFGRAPAPVPEARPISGRRFVPAIRPGSGQREL